jgi:CDP-glucose 4,6-dehydratase
MKYLFNNIYENKTVLITGHTGFKGSWLAYWLSLMGANVIGYSLNKPTEPNHFEILELSNKITSIVGDIRDLENLNKVFSLYKPDIVFHLAAQPLVRLSYENPIETYDINVMGTLKVFEASKLAKVKAIVNITSDKAYENKEWYWGYRENDPMGGYDPYSSSKGSAELLTSSYRNSFFNLKNYKKTHNTLLASCRAGNVIGGADWAKDRLIVDIMVATSKKEKVLIRNPKATRPWQHVLEPLSGYLHIGQKLLEEKTEFAEAWNFGPSDEGNISVEKVLDSLKKYWKDIDFKVEQNKNQPHEANLLKLDCSKANIKLKWLPVWDSKKAFEMTTNWYKNFYQENKVLTLQDLESYIEDAKTKNLEWTN